MMKRVAALGIVVASGLLTMTVAAFQAPAPAATAPKVLDIIKLRDNLYVITSSSPTPRESFSGGNVAVFITDAGVTLVDTKLAGWGPTLLERVKSVTNKPVTTIITTHTHGDHTGNNDAFGKVEVVAHENTRANMTKMDAFKGKEQFLPGKTYTDKLTLGKGKDQIDLYYFGPAHTNGDTVIVYGAASAPHGRHVRVEGRPALRPQQRRQLRGLSQDARQRGRRGEEHRHRDPRPLADDDDAGCAGVSAVHGRRGRGITGGDGRRQDRRRRVRRI